MLKFVVVAMGKTRHTASWQHRLGALSKRTARICFPRPEIHAHTTTPLVKTTNCLHCGVIEFDTVDVHTRALFGVVRRS